MTTNKFPKTNHQLRTLATSALENWMFDSDTDPDGDIKRGLDYFVADGDFIPDEDISDCFKGYHKSQEKWDILEEMAKGIGSQERSV